VFSFDIRLESVPTGARAVRGKSAGRSRLRAVEMHIPIGVCIDTLRISLFDEAASGVAIVDHERHALNSVAANVFGNLAVAL
jgi:hypothetical protein